MAMHHLLLALPLLLLIACGCAVPVEPPAPGFLALGDSYTIGESVPASDRWPVQLAKLLRKEGIAIGEPVIIARTGWTTFDLAGAIEKEKLDPPYALVTLLIGVNNQYRGLDVEEYRKSFVSLLQKAITLAGNKPEHAIVVSIPDWGVTPYAGKRDRAEIAAQIDRFNAVNREEAKKAGAAYVDITAHSRTAATEARLIAGDGLHPSGVMYEHWAKSALGPAKKALAR